MQPMIAISKQSITITPQVIDLLQRYTQFFVQAKRLKLEDQRRELALYQDKQPADDTVAEAIATLESEIRTAEALATSLAPAKAHLECIYRWHFEQLAEVLRKARIHLEQEQVQDMYSLKVVLVYLMEMLKAENPMFSLEKFISYINEGR